ncbi:MAG: UDP-N-acetylmuramate dehydrogenase [Alphaproteobacteria bacterium]
MAAARTPTRLIDRLPRVRGELIEGASMAAETWFRAGGPAELLFRPADEADLALFLAAKPADVPVMVIGVGSNLLVRDGGVRGVVIRIGKEMGDIAADGADIVAGAGAADPAVASAARDAGIAGLEFLSGVPGTIGGALRMNAGAYGKEMKDVTISAVALDGKGKRHELTLAELGFTYRHCAVPHDWIFLSARLRGVKGLKKDIAARMAEIRKMREASQPLRTRTGGSTFQNPPGQKAWKLIDDAGCRGLKRGGAIVSEKHTNFLINTGDATAADIEGLGEEVRRRVFARFGVKLEWEIDRVGEFLPGAAVEALK